MLNIKETDLQDWAELLGLRGEVENMEPAERDAFRLGVQSLRAEIIRRATDV